MSSTTDTPATSAAVALRVAELVLKTGRFDAMRAWYLHALGREPFFERSPAPAAAPRPAGTPERAVDVRLAFFTVSEGQVLALFGIDGLVGVEPCGPGLHHYQFGVSSLPELVAQYEHMRDAGTTPHRAANHGQATSFYFRDPDANVVEFSCSNFDSAEQERVFMAGPVFAANPSGLELDPVRFVDRFHAADPAILDLDYTAVAR